jgi:hypothetical protein
MVVDVVGQLLEPARHPQLLKTLYGLLMLLPQVQLFSLFTVAAHSFDAQWLALTISGWTTETFGV